MEEEYLYLDLDSKEGKAILAFAEQYLKENWDEQNVDISKIYQYKGGRKEITRDFIMEINVFRNGKYYSVSKNIENDWIVPRLREAKLNKLVI